MNVKSAEFEKSSSSYKQCPDDGLPEYAFLGRSNVGKSTLINLIAGTKKLAKTSSSPGKTRLINHFLINESWYLVDLPGFGYAKVSKASRKIFSKMVTDYIEKRENLVLLFLLIDARHEPLTIDLEFINYLGIKGIPFALVFTKCDKISSDKLDSNLARYFKILRNNWETLPHYFCTSSLKREGKDSILEYIDDVNSKLSKKT